MSSSSPAAGEFFIPDITTGDNAGFLADSVVAEAVEESAHDDPSGGAVGLDDYKSGGSPEEIRRQLETELREESNQELASRRREDAALLQALKVELDRSAQAHLDTIGRQAVELAYAVAERLIRARIESDPTVIERALREAVGEIATTTPKRIRVNPADAQYLQSMPELLEELKIEEVLEEPDQRRGGCLIESGEHAWDLTLVSQLAHLHSALEQVLERE